MGAFAGLRLSVVVVWAVWQHPPACFATSYCCPRPPPACFDGTASSSHAPCADRRSAVAVRGVRGRWQDRRGVPVVPCCAGGARHRCRTPADARGQWEQGAGRIRGRGCWCVRALVLHVISVRLCCVCVRVSHLGERWWCGRVLSWEGCVWHTDFVPIPLSCLPCDPLPRMESRTTAPLPCSLPPKRASRRYKQCCSLFPLTRGTHT